MNQTVDVKKSAQSLGGKRLSQPSSKSVVKKTGLVLLTLFALLLALSVGVLTWAVTAYDGIYPNVTFVGLNIGMFTKEDAKTAIESAMDTYADDAIEIRYNDQIQNISLLDAGAVLSNNEVFIRAYEIGRTGSISHRIFTVASSLFVRREVLARTDTNIGTIKKFLADFETKIFTEKSEPRYYIYDERIQIDIGLNGQKLDVDRVADTISDRIRTGSKQNIDLNDYLFYDNAQELNLSELYDKILVDSADAHLDLSGDVPTVVPHITGVSFDLLDAQSKVNANNAGGTTVIIPLIKTDPEITTDIFNNLLFRDVLAESKTTLNARNLNRTGNVRLSANAINGKILNPGDIFSYNETVGKRTYENGYKDASVYTSSGIEDQLGGGICQVSSTIYMDVIRAGLEIVERQNHSYTVIYAPLGEDATVYWGSLDFKFANNQKLPVKIEAYQEKDYVVVRLVGTKLDNNTVKIETTVLSHTPYETKYIENPALAHGVKKQKTEGHSAYKVETYRVVYDTNGKEISREKLPNSRYRKLDRVMEIGTMGAPTTSPEPSQSPPSSISPTPNNPAPSPSTDPSPTQPSDPDDDPHEGSNP